MVPHASPEREVEREKLAQLMREYEKANGKVKTLPIMRRDTTGNFHNIEADRMDKSRKRGRDKSTATHRAKARKPGPERLEFSKRGTKQAKKNAELREEW